MSTADSPITLEDFTLQRDGQYRFAWCRNHFASRYSEQMGWQCSAKISPYAFRILNGWGRYGADSSRRAEGERNWENCLMEGDIYLKAGDSEVLMAHIKHTRGVVDFLAINDVFTKREAGSYKAALTRAEQQITVADSIIGLLNSDEGEAAFEGPEVTDCAALLAA